MQVERNKILNLVEKTFASEFAVVLFMLFGALCWYFKQSLLCVIAFATFFTLIFLFCKNIKNVFALLFYLPFFLQDNSFASGVWGVYIACIACCATAVVGFTVTQFILNKKKIKRGKLFFPLFLYAATLLIGGITRFNIVAFVAFLAASIVIIAFYFIAVNFTENLTEYFSKLFIFGAVILTLEILITQMSGSGFVKNMKMGINPYSFFSAETMNTAAIMIALGIAGAYKLGLRKKYDYLYILLALFFVFGVIISKCRMMTVIAAGAFLFVYVVFFMRTQNKKLFTICTIIAAVAILGGVIVLRKKIIKIIEYFVTKGGTGASGREVLWPWCIDKFLSHPIFGYGYFTEIGDSTYREKTDIVNMILAHNSMLQWITCSGIVGAALMTLFYCYKYKTLFENFNRKKVFTALSVIIVALSGILDQAASMDFFIVLLPLIIMAGEEEGIKKLY